MRVFGSELKVGDVIAVWWPPNRDSLVPYNGSIAHLFKEGAQLATFAINKDGMTIDNGQIFERIE